MAQLKAAPTKRENLPMALFVGAHGAVENSAYQMGEPTNGPVCRGTPCGCPVLGRYKTCPYMMFLALYLFSAPAN